MDSPLATLTTEQVAAIKAAMVPLTKARILVERSAMRLQGAKADMLDAQDAFDAIFHPICHAHGVDPSRAARLTDDGTLTEIT